MAIIGTSAEAGRKAGICFALGVLSGSITWAFLTLAGVSTLIQTHPQAMTIVRIIGGTYLLWLAWNAFRRSVEGPAHQVRRDVPEDQSLRHYLRGYGVHITNPKAIMAWIMLASLALPVDASLGHALTFIGGCLMIGSVVFLGYALLFSIPSVLAAYRSAGRAIEAAMALLFGYAGLTLLLGVL
jgi:threonine/homoserine/homoserine lactone efflux protein